MKLEARKQERSLAFSLRIVPEKPCGLDRSRERLSGCVNCAGKCLAFVFEGNSRTLAAFSTSKA